MSHTYFQESVGPDSIPGYGRVQELAAYLVDLRQNIYVTNAHVTRLFQLWNDLLETMTKRLLCFQRSFRRRPEGDLRRRRVYRLSQVPGVESTSFFMVFQAVNDVVLLMM